MADFGNKKFEIVVRIANDDDDTREGRSHIKRPAEKPDKVGTGIRPSRARSVGRGLLATNQPKEIGSSGSGKNPNLSAHKMRIDRSSVALVIGKGGSKIRELEEQSGCKIRVLKEEECDAYSYVAISGGNIGKARQLIIETITPRKSPAGQHRSQKEHEPQGKMAPDCGVTVQMKIDTSLVGRLIGKGGARIRELQEESGCQIQLLNNQSNSVTSYLSITGNTIDAAIRLINQAIEPPPPPPQLNVNSTVVPAELAKLFQDMAVAQKRIEQLESERLDRRPHRTGGPRNNTQSSAGRPTLHGGKGGKADPKC